MRLGGYVYDYMPNARGYVEKLKEKNYKAAYCPDYLVSSNQTKEITELREELRKNDIILAEVGAWCNPLSPDASEAKKAKEYVIDRLRLADQLEAGCCVNIIGSASTENWYAPAAENFTSEFRKRAVEVYQEIIDSVKPVNTKMAFEVMPFGFLDCIEEYVDFLKQMNRKEAAVHLDLINLIHDPRTLYEHKNIFAEAVKSLGDKCVSAHLKDIVIDKDPFNTNMIEVLIGTGEVDIQYMAECLNTISADLPVMLEHLPDEQTYDTATRNFTKIAKEAGVNLKGGF